MASFFPSWALVRDNGPDTIVGPLQRLAWPQMFLMGLQHVVAMFGATVIAPLLMGFNPNVAILMSGIGTLIFFVVVGGRVPSYLGSSFAFIGAIIAVTGYAGQGINHNLGPALGGIIACGVVYTAVGVLVFMTGTAWIEKVMPPIVTGAIVAALGLNLSGVAIKGIGSSMFETLFALATVVLVGLVAVSMRGMVQRLMLLMGVLISYGLYFCITTYLGVGKPVDFSAVAQAPWFGVPEFSRPTFTVAGMSLIVPIVFILVAENLGHMKAVAAISGQNMDRFIGRAFIGDGIATTMSGAFGGTGVTTYAENIGVMTVTKIYSTLVFVIAALLAIVLGFSPKFGAIIMTIPAAVLGGVSIVVFGLIAVAGVRIWMNQKVDLTSHKNLIVASAILIIGTGDLTLHWGSFELHGVGTATFGGIALHALLSLFERLSHRERTPAAFAAAR